VELLQPQRSGSQRRTPTPSVSVTVEVGEGMSLTVDQQHVIPSRACRVIVSLRNHVAVRSPLHRIAAVGSRDNCFISVFGCCQLACCTCRKITNRHCFNSKRWSLQTRCHRLHVLMYVQANGLGKRCQVQNQVCVDETWTYGHLMLSSPREKAWHIK
jgi:hypothetical protein